MKRKSIVRSSMREPLAIVAAVMAAGVVQAQDVRAQLARKTLEKLPQYADADSFSFSVPFPVINAFFMDALLPGREDGPTPPPARLIRSEWTAHISVTNETVEVEIEMDVDVLDAGPFRPVMLELFPATTVYENLTLDGKEVTPIKPTLPDTFSLTQQQINPSSPNLSIPLIRTGAHHVKARIKPAASLQGGTGRIQLFQQQYALANVRFKSDEALEVRAAGAPTSLTGTKEKGTSGHLALKSTEPIVQLTWEPVRPHSDRDGLPSYYTSVAWTIEERSLTANAIMDVRITGGSLDQLTLNLPSNADRVNITGADVRDTRIEGSTAVIFLKGRIQGATQLNISCTVPGAIPSTLTLPRFTLADGRATEGGWLTVANDVGGELLEQSVSGYAPASALELPANAKGLSHATPTYVYRRESRNASATFELVQTVPFPLVDTIADCAEGECILRPDGEELVKLHYEMRNNRAQFLHIKLPEGARLLSASVEDALCTPSMANGETLIPLPRSLQTMDGLISFPIELVYIRKGAPFTDRENRAIDLPELIGVPTAQVGMTLYLPDELKLKKVNGPLEQVEQFASSAQRFEYGQGASWGVDASAVADETVELAEQELYRNYYNLGLESYKNSDFENAERYLEQAVELSKGTDKNADSLLKNIKVTSGGFGGGSIGAAAPIREDRAKASYITRSNSARNVSEAGEQEALIEEGLAMIESGNESAGVQLLEQADQLSRQLSARGEELGQRTVRLQYSQKLDEVRNEQSTNVALKQQVADLQMQTQAMVAQDKGGAKGQRLVANLNTVAKDLDYDAYEAEELLFSETSDILPSSLSIEDENKKLNRQVQILQNALVQTEQAAAPAMEAEVDLEGNARTRLEQTRRELAQVVDSLSTADAQFGMGQATLSDVEFSEQLEDLKRRQTTLENVYANNGILQDDIAQLGELIQEGEQKLEDARRRRESARQVVVEDRSGWFYEANNTFQQQELVEMIAGNNDFSVADSDNQPMNAPLEVVNGQLAVANYGNNALVLNEAVNNLALNDGNVVSIAGSNWDASVLATDNPVSALFNQTTETGQRYAVLDEAQFRTLQAMQRGAEQPEFGQRTVVPNTWNRVAGQDFRLENSDVKYNGINIDGTSIELEHNQYLALDNGSHVTILKGSAEHNWQEQRDLLPELLPVEVSQEIVFPKVGTPHRFEKTLLAENETMDMVIEYRLAQRD